ncbi:MAG: DUF6494 family protein [Alphaproteobacteria bacterium]|nr:DUF6494 family protein [Alphaproteobacteria bacterium]
MDEDVFNMSVRKFLKKVGITAQREIETAVRDALAAGTISDDTPLKAAVTLTVDGVGLSVKIDGDVDMR